MKFGLIMTILENDSPAQDEKIRYPGVAGSFYPAEKEKLADTVDGFLADAENKPVDGRLIALLDRLGT